METHQAKDGNPLVGFHLANIDGPYGNAFDTCVGNSSFPWALWKFLYMQIILGAQIGTDRRSIQKVGISILFYP